MKNSPQQAQFEQLFQPYLHLRLGAFENLKIVVGVLASIDKSYSAFEVASSVNLSSVVTDFDSVSAVDLDSSSDSYSDDDLDYDDDSDNSDSDDSSVVKLKSYYIVETELGDINCGRINGYEEAIELMGEERVIDKASAKTVNVPVLSLQQISFMCVETSHFDHC